MICFTRSITAFGVPGVLADPRMDVIPLGGSVAGWSNDDWIVGGSAQAAFGPAGAFALPAGGSKDAALLAAVPRTFTTGGELVGNTVSSLGKVFSPSGIEKYGKTVTNSKGGFTNDERPRSMIGIVADGGDIVGGQWWILLFLLAAINVFVALFNLIPLPPLDGVIFTFTIPASSIRDSNCDW